MPRCENAAGGASMKIIPHNASVATAADNDTRASNELCRTDDTSREEPTPNHTPAATHRGMNTSAGWYKTSCPRFEYDTPRTIIITPKMSMRPASVNNQSRKRSAHGRVTGGRCSIGTEVTNPCTRREGHHPGPGRQQRPTPRQLVPDPGPGCPPGPGHYATPRTFH